MGNTLKSLAVCASACTVLAAGCAAPTQGKGGPVAESPAAAKRATEIDSTTLLCQGNKVQRHALENPRPATDLRPEAQPALSGRDVEQFHAASWLIAQESSDRVMLMNKRAIPEDNGAGDVRDYQYIVVSTNSMASEPGKPVWAVVESSSCTPTLDLGDLGAGSVTLDPSSKPAAADKVVPLLVTESDCNSGQNAEGRVEVVKLVETDSTVEVVIGVRKSDAQAASCQGNPPTPFTVHLERPLGDRAVLTAAVVPSRGIDLPSRR